jgi:hypothetical protein
MAKLHRYRLTFLKVPGEPCHPAYRERSKDIAARIRARKLFEGRGGGEGA